MKKQNFTTDEDQTKEFAKKLVEEDLPSNVILLEGDLGAGKTTFAQGALKTFGAEGPFTSPTFVIMKRYALGDEKYENIFHFDCYRVKSGDVLELGWEEIISNPRNLVFVEWPERIKKIWPKKYVKISFEISDRSKRRILINSK
ncbi:MAG: tRNA (adenosine(37)-N6)-threonylcarbamoyltransferase complex ATPase subunit type 1 TsaE [Patescibacteria group bacterium]|nr:tRNA (adenosine(37)-N6)-threonylcarbamoyltransferase complex ATPase subunit type 1 TsaE [Patescibacteria group bacterium]